MTRAQAIGAGGVLLAAAGSLAGCAARAPAPREGMPVPLHRAAPFYPQAAADARVEGCVVVSFVILPDGRADQYQILDSRPPGVFDRATLSALNQWRFQAPARPGRYAQRIDYEMSHGMPPEKRCIDAPAYDALNPPGSS